MMSDLTPRVQITILVRDHAHSLPLFFKCVENIDYDPKYLSIYIHTNDNNDNTSVLLKEWSDEQKRQGKYANVYFLEESYPALKNNPGKSSGWKNEDEWYGDGGIRLKILSEIRDRSLNYAVTHGCDYYFVCDVDNFFPPETIKYCVEQNKPIFAPMMVQNDGGTPRGFYLKCASNGYWAGSKENYNMSRPIWNKTLVGTFAVELVHMCYMIRTNEVHKGLEYKTDGVKMEYVTFSASARRNGIQQFVGNEVQTLYDPVPDYKSNVDICRNLHYNMLEWN
jgi:hypothetical protein